MKKITWFILVTLILSACSSSPPETQELPQEPTLVSGTEVDVPSPTLVEEAKDTETPVPLAVESESVSPLVAVPEGAGHEGLPFPVKQGSLFTASGNCVICHQKMIDQSGKDVSFDAYWRSTMMANAARDPYWQATVRSEIDKNPEYREIIEGKCATCHMPMASTTAKADGSPNLMLDDGFINEEHPDHILAMDGVSCTVCHQIREDNFGKQESFSGGYSIETETEMGERVIYGPFPIPKGMNRVMQGSSGFGVVQSMHMKESELCATCHTLFTPYLDVETGEIAGEFPEQTPYLEWLNSDFSSEQSCQDCHMPEADGLVRISTVGGPPVGPVSQHSFMGSNTFMMTVLRDFGDEIGVTAAGEHFNASIARVLDQFQQTTASILVENSQVDGDQLSFDVLVNSKAGHKFPTGYPSRRTWLHVVVEDSDGNLVFESGAFQEDGMIEGNDNDLDPAVYESHYQVVNDPGQVQIYETIMQDTAGSVTTTLLHGMAYAKDNRLLPSGFDKDGADSAVAVYGNAGDDPDFIGGSDRVGYQVDINGAAGLFTVKVNLLYQAVGYRWAQNLIQESGEEIETFARYYDAVPNLPVLVDQVVMEVNP